jgi:hypothetical protein
MSRRFCRKLLSGRVGDIIRRLDLVLAFGSILCMHIVLNEFIVVYDCELA